MEYIENHPGITDFWNWFTSNEDKVKLLVHDPVSNQETYRQLDDLLTKINPDLQAEFHKDPQGIYHCIVTPNGVLDAAIYADDVVELAPSIPDWNIVAFRQVHQNFEIQVNGRTLRAKELRLWRRYNYEHQLADILIFVENLSEELLEPIFRCLDHTIGEYNVISAIDSIEFADMSELTDEFPAIDLETLKDEIENHLYTD